MCDRGRDGGLMWRRGRDGRLMRGSDGRLTWGRDGRLM